MEGVGGGGGGGGNRGHPLNGSCSMNLSLRGSVRCADLVLPPPPPFPPPHETPVSVARTVCCLVALEKCLLVVRRWPSSVFPVLLFILLLCLSSHLLI